MNLFTQYIKITLTILLLLLPISSYADGRLENCLEYKETITSILKSENISSDYFYLAVCESGCKVKESSKGARGFFQLMPATYYHYLPDGCNKEDIDNITCNTIAAAKYIKHLQKRFHNIKILVKAYNRGGTNFQRYGSTREADGLSRCVMNYVNQSNSK